jgi:hypothetical protein
MNEQMQPGHYTALVNLIIRSQMDTKSITNQKGAYSRGLPFTVYEVYPEREGIVWGRVSSNTGSGESLYVGLRVFNNDKAKLEKAFEVGDPSDDDSAVRAILALKDAIDMLAKEIRSLSLR